MLRLLGLFPELVEGVYTRGIYRFLASFFGRITSLMPFSITGLLLICGVLFLAFLCVRALVRRRRNASRICYIERKRVSIPNLLLNLVCIGACFYFVFVLICGPNYQRLTFAQQSGLEVRPSTAEELADLVEHLVLEANELRELVQEDTAGVMMLSESYYRTADRAQQLYPLVAEDYPMLSGYVAKPKPTVLSRLMSWLDIGGIYVAFLFEPNVNVDMMDYSIPATMMHEMSHFKGYMREDEANFIAYLACKYSGDVEFRYSGAMLALAHARNALYRADSELYYQVMEDLSPLVRADFAAASAYWRQFDGPVAKVSNTVNDVYLKSNSQQSGVKSYGEMVDLLLAEFRAQQAG